MVFQIELQFWFRCSIIELHNYDNAIHLNHKYDHKYMLQNDNHQSIFITIK